MYSSVGTVALLLHFVLHIDKLEFNLTPFVPDSCFPSTTTKAVKMKFLELEDQIGRFRFSQSCLGLVGCLCVCYAVWTPYWLKDRGLWTEGNTTESDQTNGKDDIAINALEAERVFGILSSLMAVSTAALCLVFALCWTSQTVRSYSNTQALLMAQKALYPTTLLLFTMAPTGFFFLMSWSFFTYEHREEIRQDFSSLGSSYWLGALGWILLLVVESIVFIVEQAAAPSILPDLEKAMDSWRISSQLKAVSGSSHPLSPKSNMTPKIYMSAH